MRLNAPLYEGDSLLRTGPGFSGGETEAAVEPATEAAPAPARFEVRTVSALEVAQIEARARAMRAAYLGALIGRLWSRFEAWLEKGRQEREAAYLARAANLSDLEARMRQLERKGYVQYV